MVFRLNVYTNQACTTDNSMSALNSNHKILCLAGDTKKLPAPFKEAGSKNLLTCLFILPSSAQAPAETAYPQVLSSSPPYH
jgi:hypothetical protein